MCSEVVERSISIYYVKRYFYCHGTGIWMRQSRDQVFCCWCNRLTEDWTTDRGKWISLNTGFIERFLHKRCIDAEIAVVVSRRCSLCWVLKVCVVESLRLRSLLVYSDSAPWRWGWSLCLVQILAAVVWSGCRCCWRRSMMWKHWLQRLDGRCFGCVVLWLIRCVSKWLWGVGASTSS